MGALSKRAIGAALMDQHITLFACPICQQSMHVYEQGRLVCTSNHSFDIAKQGYVNMLTNNATSNIVRAFLNPARLLLIVGL